MPSDYVTTADLSSPEAQDAYLKAAFASRHPVLIADAVTTVANARAKAGTPDDDSWATTVELFASPLNTQHLLAGFTETEAYLSATGQTLIDGPAK